MLVKSQAGQSRRGLPTRPSPTQFFLTKVVLAKAQSHGPDATGIHNKSLLGQGFDRFGRG